MPGAGRPDRGRGARGAIHAQAAQRAAILTIDGVGEWATSSWGVGHDNHIELQYELRFPHSLGLLYSAFTYYTGFRVNSGEYKVMGLAPYGEPRYVQQILDKVIDLRPDGSFRLNMEYFNFCQGLTMTSAAFHRLFGGPPRAPESRLTQRDMDLARSVQDVTEEVMLRMARHVKRQTGEEYLCLAGGVALIASRTAGSCGNESFRDVWIQPAAGDAGGALGAALFVWHQVRNGSRRPQCCRDSPSGSFLGPRFSPAEITDWLETINVPYHQFEAGEIPDITAELLEQGRVIGWFSGRMEFGPRALGSRSIIGDPRDSRMQSVMNLKTCPNISTWIARRHTCSWSQRFGTSAASRWRAAHRCGDVRRRAWSSSVAPRHRIDSPPEVAGRARTLADDLHGSCPAADGLRFSWRPNQRRGYPLQDW